MRRSLRCLAPSRSPGMKWFQEARFGMFIHFGLHASDRVVDGRVTYDAATVRSGRYDGLMRDFNPRRFDPFAWVDLARAAGARYIVATTKHTEGFCLFDSKLTDFKITHTPFRRDLIGELVAACHQRGMRIVLYYGLREWHHPHYVEQGLPPVPGSGVRPSWKKYLEYYHGQVRELCSNYGRIDGFWFDGSHRTEKEWEGKKVYRLIKGLQPRALVNDRAGYGDYVTPERHMPEDLAGIPFECCQALMRDSWWYTRSPQLFSEKYLIQQLSYVACRNGNYLLGIGPAPDGTIPENQRERMRAIGRWLKTHGEAIYGTRGRDVDLGGDDFGALGGHASTFAHGYCPSGRRISPAGYTTQGRKVFVHLFEWPDTVRVTLGTLKDPPQKAELMGTGLKLEIEKDGENLALHGLPSLPPEKSVNVLRLACKRPPRFRTRKARPTVVLDAGREEIILSPRSAVRHGRTGKGHELVVEEIADGSVHPELRCLVFPWTSTEMTLSWRLRARQGATYRVYVNHCCPDIYAGSRYELRIGREKLAGALPGTGAVPPKHPRDFRDFKAACLGTLHLKKGPNRVVFRALKIKKTGPALFFTFFRALILERK